MALEFKKTAKGPRQRASVVVVRLLVTITNMTVRITGGSGWYQHVVDTNVWRLTILRCGMWIW